MKRFTSTIITLLALLALCSPLAAKQRVRIKDVARLAGNETYTLTGYGIVVGLNNTGDSDEILIQRTVSNMLQSFNIIVDEDDIIAQNCAAVMVTGTIKGNAHAGDQVTVAIDSIGDSRSLSGGKLLLTPLLGSDGEVWATAQGPVTTGGFAFGDGGAGGEQVIKNHPTSGILTNGAKMVIDFTNEIVNNDAITYYLRQPDYTTAVNFSDTVNKSFFGSAIAKDATTIKINVPKNYTGQGGLSKFISEIEQLFFETDQAARIIFNEKTGTIVIGENVRISNAAVSHANLSVNIKNTQNVSQPNPFAEGQTQVTDDQATQIKEQKGGFKELPSTTTVGDLVETLNSLGVSARDIMIIFQLLREAGALHAELEAM